MNGPKHWKLAETAIEVASEKGTSIEVVNSLLAMAQVHATLAHTAATLALHGITGDEADEWKKVTK